MFHFVKTKKKIKRAYSIMLFMLSSGSSIDFVLLVVQQKQPNLELCQYSK